MKKIIKLTEKDLTRIVKRVINEQSEFKGMDGGTISSLMREMDIILHKKFGVFDYDPHYDCQEFRQRTDTLEAYDLWLEKNGFSPEWNTSALCFGSKAVVSSNVEKIKNQMIKKGWYK
jgi:hypothetical protein